ncbi:MAG: hypothetical protein WBQ23_06540 [Bacteroidota bacterium]
MKSRLREAIIAHPIWSVVAATALASVITTILMSFGFLYPFSEDNASKDLTIHRFIQQMNAHREMIWDLSQDVQKNKALHAPAATKGETSQAILTT